MKLRLLLILAALLIYASCKKEIIPNNPERIQIEQLLLKSKNDSIALKNRIEGIDMALDLILKKPVDSLQLQIMHDKSLLYFEELQNDSFVIINKKLLKKARDVKRPFFQGKAAFNIGYYYDEIVNLPDSAYFYYNRSKISYLNYGDSTRAGRILLNMAILQNIQNDFFGSKETLTEALRYLTLKDRKYRASVLNELGTNNRKLLNFADAVKYYGEAIATTDSKSDVFIYKNNLATSFSEEGKYDLSLKLFEKLLMDSLLTKGSTIYARILHNHAFTRWRNGETAMDTFFFKALKTRKTKNDRRGLISSYTDLGEYFSKINPKRALKHLDSAIQLSQELKIPKAETDALQLLMQLEPKNTNYKDRYIFLKDSMYQQELKVKTQFAKLKYDDQQEKVELQDLRMETAEKKVDLAEQKNQKLLFLALSGFLVILGLALAYIYRQRHKKEKLQEVLNTEKRISKTVHDVLANDIYGVMAALETNTGASTKKIIDRLDAIYQRTRDISHDTKGLAHGKDFEEELKDMIAAFNGENTTIVITGLQEVSWEKLNENTCVAIYRTVKEFLVNEKKYAEATFVALNFKQEKKRLHIHYKDNGIGCEPDQKFGVGLTNTGSRIQSLGGVFTFEPQKGKGLAVKVSLPV